MWELKQLRQPPPPPHPPPHLFNLCSFLPDATQAQMQKMEINLSETQLQTYLFFIIFLPQPWKGITPDWLPWPVFSRTRQKNASVDRYGVSWPPRSLINDGRMKGLNYSGPDLWQRGRENRVHSKKTLSQCLLSRQPIHTSLTKV